MIRRRTSFVGLFVVGLILSEAHIGCPPDCGDDGREKPDAHLGGQKADLNDMRMLGGPEADVSLSELTEGHWKAKTKGKAVFVKFYDPMCGACKHLKPSWDQLLIDFAGEEDVGVFEVDCVNLGRSLCNELNVLSYPTLRYGDPTNFGKNLDEYRGPRNYESLKRFADESLIAPCTPGNIEACKGSDLRELAHYITEDRDWSSELESLDAEFAKKDEALNHKRRDFANRVKRFNEAMDAAEKNNDSAELDRLLKVEEGLNNIALEVKSDMQAMQTRRKESGYQLIKVSLKATDKEKSLVMEMAADLKTAKTQTKAKREFRESELKALRLSELKKQARKAGVEPEKVDECDDEDDPKAAAIALILSAEANVVDVEAYQNQLESLSLSKLKQQARIDGFDTDAIDAFDDQEDPKAAAISSLLARKSTRSEL